MKITKRQLVQIIKEEKAKLEEKPQQDSELKQAFQDAIEVGEIVWENLKRNKILNEQVTGSALSDWAEFFMLASTDAAGAEQWLADYAQGKRMNLYDAAYHIKQAQDYLRQFADAFDQNLEADNR